MKPSRSWPEQVALMRERQLIVGDHDACARFLAQTNYYRFSGYARYYQQAPHMGENNFVRGTTFDEIRRIYEADEVLRIALTHPLAKAELLLRSHVAYVIAHDHGAYASYLDESFYTDIAHREPTVETCLRDIQRSKDRHILRYQSRDNDRIEYGLLPIWSAVEAWSFGTLSKVIERGARGTIADRVATSIGIAKAGFAYRVKSLVYLRNRVAHHSRLWNHSVIDAGPTPNNVRVKAKRLVGQFEPRSILDTIASLDDMLQRSKVAAPLIPQLLDDYDFPKDFWRGLCKPKNPQDHSSTFLP